MSDTVKLIIEIDKDDYDFMMECCPDLTDLMKIYEQIKKGTIITECESEDNSVLEDIKADIENMLPDGGVIHKKTVIEIINKHMESENKNK